MSNFKIGDKVVRKDFREEDGFFLSKLGRNMYYTVTSIVYGGGFIQIDGLVLPNNKHPWCACNFELYQEPGDDELPPVPRSVSYLKENGRRKLMASINGDSVNVLVCLSYRGIIDVVSYNMEPDAALQLAHDLRRMAMDIKRKEKIQ